MSHSLTEHREVLVIEDDPDIRESVRVLLLGEGFQVVEACDGDSGLKKMTEDICLVILDVMMPGKSGYEVCEEIRRFSYVPILFLTAKAAENDKLLGFCSGGDDYLTKPFSYAELSSRVNALLRRRHVYDTAAPAPSEWLESSDLRLNIRYNHVFIGQKEIDLTDTEYRILLLLMKYPQKIFNIQNIYESVWQEEYLSSYSNTIMVHIRNLRAKIEPDPQSPRYIVTVWGKGYQFGG